MPLKRVACALWYTTYGQKNMHSTLNPGQQSADADSDATHRFALYRRSRRLNVRNVGHTTGSSSTSSVYSDLPVVTYGWATHSGCQTH